MIEDLDFDYVYLDSTGFNAYELSDQEKRWLLSEARGPEFWEQRQPLIGKYGGYVLRSQVWHMKILPPRTYHADRSHPD